MTAVTREQFYQAAIDSTSKYPTVAKYVNAGDPRVLAQLSAQSTMLAMVSQQVEVAKFEPFVKVRDGMVLADAALKGVLPLARSCRVVLTATNGHSSPYVLAAGRRLFDPKGRVFEVEAAAAIAPSASVEVKAIQRTSRITGHTVAAPTSFYRIQVPAPTTDVYLASLELWKGSSQFWYSPDFANVEANEFAFQVEVDEQRRMFVCLGMRDVVGYGVLAGDTFELRIGECEGAITDLGQGDTFTLEYVYTEADGLLEANLKGVTDTGAAPVTMDELRVMSRYPSIYDTNAVFLGEFDFLLRRHITPVVFLAVWNEQLEEAVRGPSAKNINGQFFAGLIDGMTQAAFEEAVTKLIGRVDSSYRLHFVPVIEQPMQVSVTGRVSVVHDADTVAAQIKAALLGQYGRGKPEVSRGIKNPVRKQAIYQLLKEKVPALKDEQSDFDVTLTMPTSTLPEYFMPMTDASITVTITRAGYSAGLWNT